MRKQILVRGLLCCLLFSLSFVCIIQTVQAENNQTVEGIWEVVSLDPLTSENQGLLGSKVSIVRKGDSYELEWLTGIRADNTSVNYSGSNMQIMKIYYDPVWKDEDAVPGTAFGAQKPADLAQQVAGMTYLPIRYLVMVFHSRDVKIPLEFSGLMDAILITK